MAPAGCQFLIIGAGITGLTIARELVARGAEEMVILEKESALGLHASGRNSGVLHAGLYYTPDTLKAKFCVTGNRLLKEFCTEKGLTLKKTGKVIVAQHPKELPILDELKRRADACGASARLIDRKELAEIEPHAATFERALHSPETAVIRPMEVLEALAAELLASRRVKIFYGRPFLGLPGRGQARTPQGVLRFEKLINAAGAYADRVAQQFGLAEEYKILPFKGTYRRLRDDRAFLVRGNIYPVPDLRNPFLGVHLTRSVDDHVYLGPTAIPALSREIHRALQGWTWEAPRILYRDAMLLLKNSSFRSAARSEPQKYLAHFLFREARKLVPELAPHDVVRSDKRGIRPQLVHWPTRQLVMDFVLLREEDSLHILNAISPAFTSSMAFAKYAVDRFLGEQQGGVAFQATRPEPRRVA